MLTDVFIARYEDRQLFTSFGDRERRFMVQASKIVTEQLFPYMVGGKVNETAKTALQSIHDKLAMELGIDPLVPISLKTFNHTIRDTINTFLRTDFTSDIDADTFIKQRLSFIEIAFREYEIKVNLSNDELPNKLSLLPENRHPVDSVAYVYANISKFAYETSNNHLNVTFNQNIDELNERFRQGKFPLRYHSRYIQISEDSVIADHIENPFWSAISAQRWNNVAHDMSEAIDRRDNGRSEAASSAAKALESCIKIISDEKGWTKPKQSGAANYIDNLVSEKNGRFIDVWEADILKGFFREIRNPLGHGAGTAPILQLTQQQDSWAIETCMSWIKSLVTRL